MESSSCKLRRRSTRHADAWAEGPLGRVHPRGRSPGPYQQRVLTGRTMRRIAVRSLDRDYRPGHGRKQHAAAADGGRRREEGRCRKPSSISEAIMAHVARCVWTHIVAHLAPSRIAPSGHLRESSDRGARSGCGIMSCPLGMDVAWRRTTMVRRFASAGREGPLIPLLRPRRVPRGWRERNETPGTMEPNPSYRANIRRFVSILANPSTRQTT
jgi:hypothetical protein